MSILQQKPLVGSCVGAFPGKPTVLQSNCLILPFLPFLSLCSPAFPSIFFSNVSTEPCFSSLFHPLPQCIMSWLMFTGNFDVCFLKRAQAFLMNYRDEDVYEVKIRGTSASTWEISYPSERHLYDMLAHSDRVTFLTVFTVRRLVFSTLKIFSVSTWKQGMSEFGFPNFYCITPSH